MKHLYFQRYLMGLLIGLVSLHTLVPETNAQSACFQSMYDYSFNGPSNGQCIARGDFDEDGEEDVIVGVFLVGANQMRFFKGLGNGKFAAPVTFDAGSRPLAIAVYDFNGDTHLDLAVASNFTHVVSIVFGTGTGSFGAATTYSTPSGPNSIALGDFNNDTRMDMVVSCQTSGMYLLTGGVAPGTFTVSPVFSMGTGARGIIAADLNGDGNLDAATSCQTSNNVAVRFGNGAGSFGASTVFAVGTAPLAIVSGDFNGDTDIDLAVSNSTSSNITILTNNGAGSYTMANIATGGGPFSIIAANLNADANLDLAVTCEIANQVNILTGTGTGTFNTPVVFPSVATPKAITFGLFNNDSNIDLVISSNVAIVIPSTGFLSVMIGTGTANFNTIQPYGSGTTPNGVTVADFDSDGKNDLVTANFGSNNFSLLTGIGNGTFNAAVNFTMGTGPTSVCTGDFNNDGDMDVVTANTTSDNISVRLGTGTGTFGAVTNINTVNNPVKVVAAFINADANLDLVLVGSPPNVAGVMMGNGTGGFAAPVTYGVGTNPVSVCVGKFNSDNFNDIATCNNGSNNVSVLINSGTGTFGAASTVTISGGSGPVDIVCGNINADAVNDLVVANGTTSNISKLINSGTGTFPTTVNTTCNTAPTALVIGDFNRDNYNDIGVVCNITLNTTGLVDIFMNNGTGTLTIWESFATRVGPKGAFVADLNADNMPDISVANNVSNQASILINTTPYITPLGPTTFCGGGSVQLQSSLANSYNWNPSGTTQTITASTTGYYTVTTNSSFSDWCVSTSAQDTVTAAALPSVSSISGSTTICTGTTTTVTANSAAGSPTFQWYDAPVGGTLLQTGASYTTPSLVSTTSYWVQVTDGTTGCTSSPRYQVTVTVQDLVAPVISGIPANITVNAGAGCTATASWTAPTANDNCTLLSFTTSHAIGSSFPLGLTTVTYTATDAASNVSTGSFTVTVNDVTNPVISGTPANITQTNTIGACNKSVSWAAATGSDNCSLASLVCSHTNPFTFPVGTTTVTYTATDGSGNVSTTSFTVTITDTQVPTIAGMPSNITTNVAAGTCCKATTWTAPTASDNCGISSFTASHTSGFCFPKGVTTVTYTATDLNGNVTTGSFTITVVDNINPTLSGLPANQTVNASNGACFRAVTWTSPTGADNCPGVVVTQTAGLPSGSNYPVGVNTITFTATDAVGNVATGSFTITVVDNQLPYYTAFPSNINTNCSAGLCGANVTWTAPVNADNCGVQTQTSTHTSGSLFSVGTTTVTYTLTDVNGNVHNQSFTVTVVDNIAPTVVGCPTTMTVCEGTTVNYTAPTGNDNCPGVVVTQPAGLPPGSVFPVGTTLCTFKIEDASGNFVNCNFNVIVNANPIAALTLTDDAHEVCHPVYTLAGGSPAGGTYSGTGVTGGNFNPGTAGLGPHTITYTYTATNGCSDVVTDVITVSICTGIDEHAVEELHLMVYPNPNTGDFTIEIPSGYENSQLHVFNGMGELVHASKGSMSGKTQISLGDVQRGVYMLILSSTDKAPYTARIVVN